MRRVFAAVAAVMMPLGGVAAAPLNQGFEAGLADWSTLGTVTAVPSSTVTTFDGTVWAVSPHQTTMARLDSEGATGAEIEKTLGLTAGSLSALNVNPNDGNVTNGAAIWQDFAGTIGDVVTQWFNYIATDYIPFNDPAFVAVINLTLDTVEHLGVLASIHGTGIAVGTSGNSGWHQFSHTLQATGDYRIAFITTNDKDTILNSVLFLDNQAGTTVVVPEPASLALLGMGLLGLGWAARRRRAA